jgi:hypothetical protein
VRKEFHHWFQRSHLRFISAAADGINFCKHPALLPFDGMVQCVSEIIGAVI